MKNPKRVERKRLRRAMVAEQRHWRRKRREARRWVFGWMVPNACALLDECGL